MRRGPPTQPINTWHDSVPSLLTYYKNLWCFQIISKPPTPQLSKGCAVIAISNTHLHSIFSMVSLLPDCNYFFWSVLHLTRGKHVTRVTLHRHISQCPLLGCIVCVYKRQKAYCEMAHNLPTFLFLSSPLLLSSVIIGFNNTTMCLEVKSP